MSDTDLDLSDSVGAPQSASYPQCVDVLGLCQDLQGHSHGSQPFLISPSNGLTISQWSDLQGFSNAELDLSQIATNLLSSKDSSFEKNQIHVDLGYSWFTERGPKRKHAYIWQCCNCGQGGISIKSEACRSCGYPRCAYCPVSKVRV
ncbi:hypothetical protein CH063_00141 [Colletotrichum higginsianum]|nr:hypothetical protein CH063_00141 [Colletotrichum higginsianum]